MSPSPAAAVRRLASTLRPVLVSTLASAAGRIRRAQTRLRPEDVRRKGVGDFVTAIDLRVERWLRTQLQRLLPAAGFLGEESTASALDCEFVWVVDPIDGTSNFARGLPHFAASVALLWRGAPLLAAIHCFPEDCGYDAIAGRGARRRGRVLRTPAGRFDDGAVLGCQWFRGEQHLEWVARVHSCGGRLRNLGCTVAQLADVAAGRLDANVQQQGRLWDFAAAALVVTEAGGRFTDWSGLPLFPVRDWQVGHQASVAAAPNVHRRLLRLLG